MVGDVQAAPTSIPRWNDTGKRLAQRSNANRRKLDDIVICRRRAADRYRAPLMELDLTNPKNEAVAVERERLLARTNNCQEISTFLVGCGKAGIVGQHERWNTRVGRTADRAMIALALLLQDRCAARHRSPTAGRSSRQRRPSHACPNAGQETKTTSSSAPTPGRRRDCPIRNRCRRGGRSSRTRI